MATERLNVLLLPVGSAGDVHPFIGLGHELKRRGHDVTIITNSHFQDLVEEAGFPFVEHGTDEQFRQIISNPDIWKASPRSAQLIFNLSAQSAGKQFDLIMERNLPGNTVLAAGSLAFGARMAREKLQIPLATVHLAPSLFISVHEPPRLPMLNVPDWAPKFIKRLYWKLGDRALGKEVRDNLNAHRKRIGLKPVHNIILDWWHSPDLVLAMFPEWFARPQPDWPKQTRCVGFPLYDERREHTVSDALNHWMIGGQPPVAFTPGSANIHGRAFFRAAVDACAQLQRRGLLLTRHEQQVPADLPEIVRHVEFTPFSELLPRCAAMVSHGGIGTVSQGIAAGIPQIVSPMAHDQFDNAARLEDLGIGATLPTGRFKAARLADMLGRLMQDDDVRRACKAAADRVRQDDALRDSASAIEQLAVQ